MGEGRAEGRTVHGAKVRRWVSAPTAPAHAIGANGKWIVDAFAFGTEDFGGVDAYFVAQAHWQDWLAAALDQGTCSEFFSCVLEGVYL